MSPWLPLPQQPRKTFVSSPAHFCFHSSAGKWLSSFWFIRGKSLLTPASLQRDDDSVTQCQVCGHVLWQAQSFSRLPLLWPLWGSAWKSQVNILRKLGCVHSLTCSFTRSLAGPEYWSRGL
jgi:hypothetical protein